MRQRIIIGSRGSRLALVQTESVAARLKEINPRLEISIRKIVTGGDRNRTTSLDKMGVAIFVKELEEALLDRRIDLAVHSLKDVPTEIPAGLSLMAVTERLDPRDALIARVPLDRMAPHSRIGTDSLRRAVQMAQYYPELDICSIRGNVDTRLRKVATGEYDGIIVAAAALTRLGWLDRITEYLPLERFLPAVGQGALVVEGRTDDEDIIKLVAPLNHLPTWQSAMAERAFLLALGGGCRAPIAALGRVKDSRLWLEGMAASVTEKRMLRLSAEGNAGSPEEVGRRLAQELLAAGAAKFIAEVNAGERR